MAGGSALKLETGYCVSYLDSAFQKGASSCKLCFSSLFAFLPFHKAEEVQHIPFIPSDSHRGFYFPPTSNTDRAVNIIEIKYFIILWTYSQWRQDLVVIPPLSPERKVFCGLPFSELLYSYVFLGLRTSACFPLLWHSGINYPPAWG